MLVANDHNYQDRNRWKLDFTKRVGRTLLVEKEVAEELTVFNYQEKFYNLLCYEEKEHIELLSRKYGGILPLRFTAASMLPFLLPIGVTAKLAGANTRLLYSIPHHLISETPWLMTMLTAMLLDMSWV